MVTPRRSSPTVRAAALVICVSGVHGYMQRRISRPSVSRSSTATVSPIVSITTGDVDEFVIEASEKLKPLPYPIEYDPAEEMINLQHADIGMADNFYETTLPRTKKMRIQLLQDQKADERIESDKNFYELMNTGFERRLLGQQLTEESYRDEYDFDLPPAVGRRIVHSDDESFSYPSTVLRYSALSSAAAITSNALELTKSKEEQLKELKAIRLNRRGGLYQIVPQKWHKYLDYMTSLKKDPSPKDLRQNVALGAVFAMITLTQARKWMFFIIGTLGMMSTLVTRNMTQGKPIAPGMPLGLDRRKEISWSQAAFKTALAITMLYTGATGVVSTLAVNLFRLPSKLRLVMASCIMSTAYFTSFYEVYEEKSKSGWRWKQALEGALPDEVEAQLKAQVFGSHGEVKDTYDYDYDPEIDEYPKQPKYIDENPFSGVENPFAPEGGGGSGSLDEYESEEHFQAWREYRKNSRKPPVIYAAPEEPWLGGKEGMYVDTDKAPKWLSAAYRRNVLNANNWRAKPTRFEKDTSEFEPVTGTIGFRDKAPKWMNLFGTGVWEEKITASRRAARAFGTYRKTMFKIDKKVKLLPCDGADK